MEFKFRAGDLRPSPPPPPMSGSPRPPEFHYLSEQGFPDASLKVNTNMRTMRNSFDTNEAMHCEMELMRLREEKLLMEIERERFLKEEARKKLMLFEREMEIRGVVQSTSYSFRDRNRWARPSSTTPSPSLAWGVAQPRLSAVQATSSSLSPAPRVVESTSYSFHEHNQGGGLFSRSSFSATPSPLSVAPTPFSRSSFSAAPSPFSVAPTPFSRSTFSTVPTPFSATPSPLSVAPTPFSRSSFSATPLPFSVAPTPFSRSLFSTAPSPFSVASMPTAFSATPTPTPFSAAPTSFSVTPTPFSAAPMPTSFSATKYSTFSTAPSLFSDKPFSSMPSVFTVMPSLFSAKPSSFSATLSPSPAMSVLPSPATTVSPSPAMSVLPSPATTVSPPPATTVSPPPATTVSPPPASTVSPPPATTVSPPPATTVSAPPTTTVSAPPTTTVSPPPTTTLMPSSATTSVMHSFNDWWKIEHLKSSNPIGFGVVSLPPRVEPLIADVKKEPQVLHDVKSELKETPDPEVFTENQKVKTPSVFTFGVKPFGVKKNPMDEWSCADLQARTGSQAASGETRKLLKVTELAGSVGAKEKESRVGETLQCVKTEGGFIQNPIASNFLKFAVKEDKQPNELGIELPHENPNPYVVREKQNVETLSTSTFGIKPFGGKKNPKEEWSCELCHLTVWTEMHFSEHLYGRRHKRKIAELRARMFSNVSRAATEPVPNKRRKLLKVTEASGSAGAEEKESKVGETLQCEKTEGSFKLNATVPNFLKFAAKEDKQQNELATEPLQEKSNPNVFREKQKAETPLASTAEIQPFGVKKSPKEWSCAQCQITMLSERTFYEHLHGKKHKRKLIMRPQQKPDPREKQKVKMPSASSIDIQPFCVKKKKMWKCAPCQVETVGKEKAFSQHICGKRHRHRHKEALLVAQKGSNVSQAATDPVPNERRNLLEVTEASGSAGTEKKEPKDGETVKYEKTEVIFIDLT